MIQAQVLPWAQPIVMDTFYHEIEPLWQQVVKA